MSPVNKTQLVLLVLYRFVRSPVQQLIQTLDRRKRAHYHEQHMYQTTRLPSWIQLRTYQLRLSTARVKARESIFALEEGSDDHTDF